jgi:hypothetical protein
MGCRISRLFFGGGEAGVADAAYFGAGDGDLHVEVAGDLFLELFVEAAFKFADFAATQAGDVDMVARAVGFVVVAVAAEMQEIKFVDEAVFFEEIDGAVDGDEMDAGIDFYGAVEDLVDVEVLFGGVHDLENDATLASEANAALAEGLLEVSGGFGGVDALSGRNAVVERGGHGRSLAEGVSKVKRAGAGSGTIRESGPPRLRQMQFCGKRVYQALCAPWRSLLLVTAAT